MAAAILTAGSDGTVTIPRVWMDYLRVRPQDEVEIDSTEAGIVIRRADGVKSPRIRKTTQQRIAEFEREHGPLPYERVEIDWGPDVGAERFWEEE